MNMYTQIKKNVKHYYEFILDNTKGKYVRESLIALLAAGLFFGGYTFVQIYKKRQNEQAFAGLLEISKSYEKSLTAAREQASLPESDRTENPWEDTQLLLQAISSAHAGSSLAPFFMMYQAELALDQDGDYETACKLMEKGCAQLSKKSVFYDMFNLKRIKMSLDNPDLAIRTKALHELEKIAANDKNYYYQEALHLLGMYYAYENNMPEAIKAWTALAQSQPDKSLLVSPWVAQSQEKLKSLHISYEAKN